MCVKGGAKLDHGGGVKLDHLAAEVPDGGVAWGRQEVGGAVCWRAFLLCSRR